MMHGKHNGQICFKQWTDEQLNTKNILGNNIVSPYI